jgi:hypothetical protein
MYMGNSSDSLETSIFNSMNLKSTEELRQIWQEHDTNEWTPTALQAVGKILIDRLGALPERDVDESQDEVEEDVDLYHDPERSLKVAGWSNTLSIVVLSVYSVFALGFLFYMLFLTGGSSLVVVLISASFILLFGGVIFAILQGLGEIILILLDIEDNTRPR